MGDEIEESHYGHTYNRTRAFIKAVFQKAIDCGKLFGNPTAKLNRVGVAPVIREVPTIAQFKGLLIKMRSYKFGSCQHAADLAGLFTGNTLVMPGAGRKTKRCFTSSRLSEGLAIQWRHVDWKAKEITITGIKNRKISNEPPKIVKFPIWSELETLLIG